MTTPALAAVSTFWWNEVFIKVEKAVVFLDKCTAECLHWNGGVLKLIERGAITVKEFTPIKNGINIPKAVFILGSPIWRQTLTTLRSIVTSSSFHHCIVFTSSDERVHNLAKYGNFDGHALLGGKGPFELLQNDILTWMGNQNYTVEIHHVPLSFINVCPTLFLMPPFDNLFPPISVDMELLRHHSHVTNPKSEKRSIEKLEDIEFLLLPLELKVLIAGFVTNFHSLMENLSIRLDCYSIGYFSSIISSELEQLHTARMRRKVIANKVSVLFIDRTLDMAQGMSYDFDTLFDKILCLLPKFPYHKNDVAVNISPLCAAKMDSTADAQMLVPGSLACSDTAATTLVNSLVTSKSKEWIIEINRQLVEALSKEMLMQRGETSRFGTINADTLLSHVLKFKNHRLAMEKHLGVLQHALATIEVLQHPDASKMDTLLGIEKALMQMLAEKANFSSLKLRIVQLIRERKKRHLLVEHVITLLVRMCTLFGKGFIRSEDEGDDILKAVLGDALLEDYKSLPQYLKKLVGPEVDELTVHKMVKKLFSILESVSNSRENLKKYRSVFDPGNSTQPATYLPLVHQILDDIYNPAKPDVVDLECKSTGLKEMLKSGLGLFMNVNKPRPSDHNTIVIFIVGGITATEIRKIKDLLASKQPNIQVIVGSTRLVTPDDLLQLLLEPDRFMFF